MERSKVLTVISLGVGVQSSTMALMSAKGVLPKVDCAIFADTGYEPKKVYEYLEWIKTQLPFPVYTVEKGNIKDDMLNSISNGTRFLVAPFYTKNSITGKKGMVMRQCTNDYKIQPIRKKIRELCNINYGKHFPKDKYVDQWIGISTDEISRMKPARDKYINNVHPLIDLKMSRKDCLKWMSENAFPLPEKSACICCPFHDDKYWYFMKHNRPEEFADAVEFDKKIRRGSRKQDDELFTHRKCIPLDEVNFDIKTDQPDMFNNECEGMCGV
jgi:hypothetical protein